MNENYKKHKKRTFENAFEINNNNNNSNNNSNNNNPHSIEQKLNQNEQNYYDSNKSQEDLISPPPFKKKNTQESLPSEIKTSKSKTITKNDDNHISEQLISKTKTSSDGFPPRVALMYSDAFLRAARCIPPHPSRALLCYHLIQAYGLTNNLRIMKPNPCSPSDLCRYHRSKYIETLQSAEKYTCDSAFDLISEASITIPLDSYKLSSNDNEEEEEEEEDFNDNFEDEDEWMEYASMYGLNEDSPAFKELFSYVQYVSGASVTAARMLMQSPEIDIAINWEGGRHHAKKTEANGYCYINDAVLAILEFLSRYKRVMYIDIDVHHGDGVQEAFESTNRVLTVSFHQYGPGLYPGSGAVSDIGKAAGRFYSVNVPLKEGTSDKTYITIFKTIIPKLFERFVPDAVVFVCGADSLHKDPLGTFHLSLKSYRQCTEIVRDLCQQYRSPLLVLGGGGYHETRAAICWTVVTAVLLRCVDSLDPHIPEHDLFSCYGPDFMLRIPSPLPSSSSSSSSSSSLSDSDYSDSKSDTYILNLRDTLLTNANGIDPPSKSRKN